MNRKREKSPTYTSHSDDDDDLPDVNIGSKVSIKISPSQTALNQKQFDTEYKKALEFRKKITLYKENVEFKKQTEEIIKKGGFRFDRNAQLIKQEQDEAKAVFDDSQTAFLNKYLLQTDPLIPYKPKLNSLFDFNYISHLYKYPKDFNYESFKFNRDIFSQNLHFKKILNGHIHEICDKHVFKKYIDQLKDESDKICLLNHLFYYTTLFTNDFNTYIACETLCFILINKNYLNIKWKISGAMLIQVYKNLGLDFTQFLTNNHFADLYAKIENKDENCIKLNEAKKCRFSHDINENIAKEQFETFDVIMNKLLEVILYCFKNRSKYYSEAELDFIFYLIVYTSLDTNYERINAKIQTTSILNEIILSYTDDQWSTKKHELVENLFTLSLKPHHIIIYLNEFFEATYDERVRDFSFLILFKCIMELLDSSECIERDVEPKLQFNLVVDGLERNGLKVFTRSSYEMYTIIKCLDPLLAKLIYFEKIDKKQMIRSIGEIKQELSDLRRSVKDRNVENEGRHQIKAMITNTLQKCEYYVNKQRLKLDTDDEPVDGLNGDTSLNTANVTMEELKLTVIESNEHNDSTSYLDNSLLPSIN